VFGKTAVPYSDQIRKHFNSVTTIEKSNQSIQIQLTFVIKRE